VHLLVIKPVHFGRLAHDSYHALKQHEASKPTMHPLCDTRRFYWGFIFDYQL